MQVIEVLRTDDGATKFLLRLEDNLRIEAVFMSLGAEARTDRRQSGQGPDATLKPKDSLCISSQVGCALKCQFCSTGALGLERNLTSREITEQVTTVLDYLQYKSGGRSFGVSYMGMGEPLQNLEAVIESKQLLATWFPAFSFHLSTVGLPDQLRELGHRSPDFGLQISLHTPDDAVRSRLVPVNRAHPISEVLAAGEAYAAQSGREVLLNYCLMAGVNDREEDATALVTLLRQRPFRLQLVTANAHESIDVRPSTPTAAAAMLRILRVGGIRSYYGYQLGTAVGAGCGQLDADYRVGEFARWRRPVPRDGASPAN